VPAKNLIVNIGFGEDATHTKTKITQPDTYELNFPLRINHFLVPDREYDNIYIGFQLSKQKEISDYEKIKEFVKKKTKKILFLK
jgi:hypothetical protein